MKKWSILAVLALAQFVMVLDSTVMNVSISTVVADLNTTVSALQAAITFYTLTMAAFMLIGAKFCSKWGLMKAFTIGSIVYGIGSFITAISQNVTQLFIGWSIIEGLGAVLVIPAIAAIIAVTYKGKDRITAFAIIGGISGAAAAAGPLIGGFMTTYLSWRYVFLAETIVMAGVLLGMAKLKAKSPARSTEPIDFPSAVLSIVGMTSLVYGMLQSKTWGWITPMAKPEINGHEIAPLGISIVAYLIVFGLAVLYWFYNRQAKLEAAGKNPLLGVSMLSIKQLRSGLAVLMSQYMITAAVFFVVPIYLQIVLGLNALDTGLKILPLLIGLILFSIVGSKMAQKRAPRRIVRTGQLLLVIGSLFLLAAINPTLSGPAFWAAMFILGSGLGLLASQLGNINMSSVDDAKSSEVGGLQGTFQNLGSSFGTALIGSVMVATLTTTFVSNINSTTLPDNVKNYVNTTSTKGVQIVSAQQVNDYALSHGLSEQDAQAVTDSYTDAQMSGLKEAVFFLVVVALLSIVLSRSIPNSLPIPKTAGA